jgi:hypothetical protein
LSRSPYERARWLLRADAAFEIALGLPLVTGRRSGLLDVLELPAPASERLAVAFGGALLPFAGVLWASSEQPRRDPLLGLAAVNLATGAAFAAWLLRRRSDAGPAATAAIGATAAGLVVLAAAEARVAPRLGSD